MGPLKVEEGGREGLDRGVTMKEVIQKYNIAFEDRGKKPRTKE